MSNSALYELASLASVGSAYESGIVELQVKTNYTPALTLYTGGAQVPSSAPSGLSKLLGIEGGVRVLDGAGNVIASIGPWPATDPLRVALALGALGLITWGAIRLIRAV